MSYIFQAMVAGSASLCGQISKGNGDTLNLPDGMVNIGGHGKFGYLIEGVAGWNPVASGHHDSSFSGLSAGDDIYLYAVQNDDGKARVVASKNTTYPNGFTADNSRKIGGFHFGRVRAVSASGAPVNGSGSVYGAGWEGHVSPGILPNSVWDLFNRPKCDPTGMARVGNFWVDIYLTSAAEAVTLSNSKLASGKAQSKFGQTPLTGTEGLHWYTFGALAQRSRKRMLSYEEWCMAAEGSPEGLDGSNANAWTRTTNTGRASTGAVEQAVSAHGVADCVGNVWEWTSSQVIRTDDIGVWGWRNVEPSAGTGELYMQSPHQLTSIITGGGWDDGAHAGARTAILFNYPWNVGTIIGCRLACDSL